MNITIEELKNTWQFPFNRSKEIIKDIFSIITKYAQNSRLEKYRDYIQKNNFNEDYPFNIFELISDTYYKENFHSDIIAKLLEHKTVLKHFLDFIKVDNSKYLNNNYEVVREENKIDILIETDTNCIIIENKLNWAKDMDEQLSRYYDCCLKNNLEVDKVVYLSPNILKQPEPQSIKDIPKCKIKIIYGYDGEDEDFYTKVIKNSLEDLKNNNESKEWILLAEHYLKILRETGVTKKMDKLTQDFYNEIRNNPDEYEKIKLIVDMYNNLIATRFNNLASEFQGVNYKDRYEQCFYREFKSKKRGLNYTISIYIDNDNSDFYLSSIEDTEEKQWQDNKDIEVWLKKHNLFDGFYFQDEKWWTKKFKFPKQENELYEFTEKVIKLLEEDIESICSK